MRESRSIKNNDYIKITHYFSDDCDKHFFTNSIYKVLRVSGSNSLVNPDCTGGKIGQDIHLKLIYCPEYTKFQPVLVGTSSLELREEVYASWENLHNKFRFLLKENLEFEIQHEKLEDQRWNEKRIQNLDYIQLTDNITNVLIQNSIWQVLDIKKTIIKLKLIARPSYLTDETKKAFKETLEEKNVELQDLVIEINLKDLGTNYKMLTIDHIKRSPNKKFVSPNKTFVGGKRLRKSKKSRKSKKYRKSRKSKKYRKSRKFSKKR